MEKIIQNTKYCCLIITLLLFSTRSSAQGTDIRWLRSIHNNGANSSLLHNASYSSYGVAVLAPFTQLAYGYLAHDSVSKRNGWQTLASLALTTGLTYGIKYAADRPRPWVTYPDIIPYEYKTDKSMPSGHTSISFSTATCLTLQYRKWYVAAPAFLYAGFVGYTRLRAGDHYPSDVLVGALVGSASAFITYKGQQWLLRKKKH
jgi:membrane-associated phospholipid phosphatase